MDDRTSPAMEAAASTPYAGSTWKQEQLEHRRCVWCAEKLPQSWKKTRCESCINSGNANSKARRTANRQAGLCGCGNRTRRNGKTCVSCYNYYRNWMENKLASLEKKKGKVAGGKKRSGR